MEIPWQDIDEATLSRLLSELVTRDGTDYGREERSTQSKIDTAMKRLQSGEAVLLWNEEIESASLVSKEELERQRRELKKLEARAGIESEISDKDPAS